MYALVWTSSTPSSMFWLIKVLLQEHMCTKAVWFLSINNSIYINMVGKAAGPFLICGSFSCSLHTAAKERMIFKSPVMSMAMFPITRLTVCVCYRSIYFTPFFLTKLLTRYKRSCIPMTAMGWGRYPNFATSLSIDLTMSGKQTDIDSLSCF